jgi:hypothetical protein
VVKTVANGIESYHRKTRILSLTHFSKAMNQPARQKPPTTLELIDLAVAAAKRAAHSCRNEAAREHFEYALALMSESWIAKDGQEARSAAKIIGDVASTLDLFASVNAQRTLQPNIQ